MGSWCLRDRMEWKEHEKNEKILKTSKVPSFLKSAVVSKKQLFLEQPKKRRSGKMQVFKCCVWQNPPGGMFVPHFWMRLACLAS